MHIVERLLDGFGDEAAALTCPDSGVKPTHVCLIKCDVHSHGHNLAHAEMVRPAGTGKVVAGAEA
jgi:hypothetical protein